MLSNPQGSGLVVHPPEEKYPLKAQEFGKCHLLGGPFQFLLLLLLTEHSLLPERTLDATL